MIERLTVHEIVRRIELEKTFHAVSEDYSFTLKIEEYVPYACGAVHDGHHFRKELWEPCLHTTYERWYEEDPCTKEFVKTHPIVIAGCDSRFEYDLNREPENAIYEDAWGKKLWKQPLTEEMKERSLAKHHAFYRVVHSLIKKLEEKFGTIVVYDMHSYNWRRWDREVPVVNLGTTNIDNDRFGDTVEEWRQSLSEIKLPHGTKTTSRINDVFFGKGYFLKYITDNFSDTLVLATEFSKIYCNELDMVIYPEVVDAIERQLRTKMREHAQKFYNEYN